MGAGVAGFGVATGCAEAVGVAPSLGSADAEASGEPLASGDPLAPGVPLGAGAIRDGARVYVACHNSNTVAVIDTKEMKVIAEIPTEPGPVQVSVAPDQKFAYVASDGRGTVQKIELATNKVVKTIRIAPDAGSHGVAFGVDGKLLFITNTGASTAINPGKIISNRAARVAISTIFAGSGSAFP